MDHDRPIIFFDGVCNLCNGFVDYILKVDKNHNFYLTSLQGKTAKSHLPLKDTSQMDSVILKDGSKLYYKSSAIFKIALSLKGPLLLILPFWVLPRPITNWVYDLIASRRYSLFGKKELCRLPSENEAKHFLD